MSDVEKGNVELLSGSSQKAGSSWLSYTDRARNSESKLIGQRHKVLTEKKGIDLRFEAFSRPAYGDPHNWNNLLSEFRSYYKDNKNSSIEFKNEDGEKFRSGCSNRFQSSYKEKLYAKFNDLEENIKEEYSDLTTVLLTNTASYYKDEDKDDIVSPIDHLIELDSSYDAVRRELHRVLDGMDWEYITILEPHKTGYAHRHTAVFIDGEVSREMFKSVLEAHVRNCSLAKEEAHTLENSVSVKRDEQRIKNLSAYLSSYLGEYGKDVLDQPLHYQLFYSMLWATEKQGWRPSNGSQEYMAYEREPKENFEVSAFIDSNGDRYSIDSDSNGEVLRISSYSVYDDPEPPPT